MFLQHCHRFKKLSRKQCTIAQFTPRNFEFCRVDGNRPSFIETDMFSISTHAQLASIERKRERSIDIWTRISTANLKHETIFDALKAVNSKSFCRKQINAKLTENCYEGWRSPRGKDDAAKCCFPETITRTWMFWVFKLKTREERRINDSSAISETEIIIKFHGARARLSAFKLSF